MNIDRLSKMRIGVLTEDSVGTPNPEKLVGNFIKKQVEAGNMVEDESQQNQQITSKEPPQQEQSPQQIQQQQQDDNPYSIENQQNDDQNSNAYDQQEQYSDNDIPYVPDDYDSKDDTPKLKILQSLSDKEYKLNNIHCHEQFKELYSNVENSINNNIIDIVTKSDKQRQIVTFVHNNLSKMLDDLNTYLVYKFSDIYEDNILAYITFLKRYQIAMKIIKLINDENHKAEN